MGMFPHDPCDRTAPHNPNFDEVIKKRKERARKEEFKFQFNLTINTDNAAFGEMPEEKIREIMLILEDFADKIFTQRVDMEDLKDGVSLRDTNGNNVGNARIGAP